MKKIYVSALALSLMSGLAVAQTAPTTPQSSTEPKTNSDMPPPAAQTPPAPIPSAAPRVLSSAPAQSMSVTNWYKQSVYDQTSASVGQIMDVLLDQDGKATALVVGVGGFLGMGEHNVAVPFNAVKSTMRDGKAYLTISSTKDQLKSSPGLRYDNNAATWVADTATTTAPAKSISK